MFILKSGEIVVNGLEKKDYRTELEKKGIPKYFTVTDGSQIRILDFNLAENPNEYIIMLIPGFATVFQSWQRVMELLTQEFRVIYFESREKVTSIMPKKLVRKITLSIMAHDMKEVIEQIKLDGRKYITICSSTGGNVLTEALNKKWINPTEAIMVGRAIEFHLQGFVVVLSALIPNFLIQTIFMPIIRWYISVEYVNKKNEPEQLDKYMRALEEANMRKIMPLFRRLYRYNSWDMPPKVETRTLLIEASLDRIHATEECLRVHELMPKSIYVDLSSNRASHSDPFVDEIKKFIDKLENWD